MERWAACWSLFLFACATFPTIPPTPGECVVAGVRVADGVPVTGKIVKFHFDTAETVAAKCKGADGCSRAAGFVNFVSITPKGEYEVWYSEPSLKAHEECHAFCQQPGHTEAYMRFREGRAVADWGNYLNRLTAESRM